MRKLLRISTRYYKMVKEEQGQYLKKDKIDIGIVEAYEELPKENALVVVLVEWTHPVLRTKEFYERYLNEVLTTKFVIVKADNEADKAKEITSSRLKINSFIYKEPLKYPIDKKRFKLFMQEVYKGLEGEAGGSLHKELLLKEEQLEGASNILKLLYSAKSAETVLGEVVKHLKSLIGCKNLVIRNVLQGADKALVSQQIYPKGEASRYTYIGEGTLLWQVIKEVETVNIIDKENLLRYKKEEGLSDLLEGLVVAPISQTGGEIQGILEVIDKEGFDGRRVFRSRDISLINMLRPYIGLLIRRMEREAQKDEMVEFTKIGKALLMEREHLKLLKFILDKSIELTESDCGTIYIVEKLESLKVLRFAFSSLMLTEEASYIPLDKNSISGYVGLTKEILNISDAYKVDEKRDYKLNLEYDKAYNYKTKSMLVVPMTNQRGDVIGVIQLINKKLSTGISLDRTNVDRFVIPYLKHDEDLIVAIAGQAAVAIENNILYHDIQKMLEGFVRASVTAIESRDPTTSGHSERVAVYTVELAKVVNKINKGSWAAIGFNEQQLTELRYASLLHDFGKVGIRESVLVKAKKLYSHEVDLVVARFNFIKRTLQYESGNRKIEYLKLHGNGGFEEFVLEEGLRVEKESKDVDKLLNMLLKANDPLVIEKKTSEIISNILGKNYLDINDEAKSYITKEEAKALLIKQGTLLDSEREEIQKHVTHTFEFLRTIPWTQELKNLPKIAYAHHERLNGTGYPRGLNDTEIPLQAKIMTVADIYDALVARDRHYKKSLRYDEALDILKYEVKSNHIDGELVDAFIESKLYRLLWKEKGAG